MRATSRFFTVFVAASCAFALGGAPAFAAEEPVEEPTAEVTETQVEEAEAPETIAEDAAEQPSAEAEEASESEQQALTVAAEEEEEEIDLDELNDLIEKGTGWIDNGEARYYLLEGEVVHGWKEIDGGWYLFDDEEGALQYGWVTTARGKLYLDPDTGKQVLGWKKLDGTWRYFLPLRQGYMKVGWEKIRGNWYYFDENGSMVTGWKQFGNDYYYFNTPSGIMHTGALKANGTFYFFDGNGKMHRGLLSYGGQYYYYHDDGTLHTGWLETGGNKFYFFNNGQMARGALYAGGTWYYFHANGMQYTPSSRIVADALQRSTSYSSPTDYLIMVNTGACRVVVLHKAGYGWEQLYEWACTPGKPSTPTVTGVFAINSNRGYVFGWGHGYSCYYYTSFYGDYLFHSVLYDEGTFRVQDGRLGAQLSHGCVRLDINNAKWINQNAPNGTTVVVW